jgi:hypothetical protein
MTLSSDQPCRPEPDQLDEQVLRQDHDGGPWVFRRSSCLDPFALELRLRSGLKSQHWHLY